MSFYPGCTEDMPHEAAFMERLTRFEGMKLMKTQGRRLHLSEGTGSAKAQSAEAGLECAWPIVGETGARHGWVGRGGREEEEERLRLKSQSV